MATRLTWSDGPLLRHPGALRDPDVATEKAWRVRTARVALADYELLQRDFPELRTASLTRFHPALKRMSPACRAGAAHGIIDAWLLRNAALVSEVQVRQQDVNSPILTVGPPVAVYRPPRYGRSIVAALRQNRKTWRRDVASRWPLRPAGLLDLKGAGVAPDRRPKDELHSNGLLFLGEALGDYLFQRVIEMAFQDSGSRLHTVPTYAILDLGFDVLHNGRADPAGIQVRRAHRRPRGGVELPNRGSVQQNLKLQVELILRHYGITSANGGTEVRFFLVDGRLEASYGGELIRDHFKSREDFETFLALVGIGQPCRFDGVNVQLTRETSLDPPTAHVVDFGNYEVVDQFQNAILSLVADRPMRWGGAIEPDSPHFVQPIPSRRLPLEFWGRPQTEEERRHAKEVLPRYVRFFRPDVVAFELATAFRRRQSNRAALARRLAALLDTCPLGPDPNTVKS